MDLVPGEPRANRFLGAERVRADENLASDELITRVTLPLPASNERLRLYKVSRRRDLDIALCELKAGRPRAGKREGDVLA